MGKKLYSCRECRVVSCFDDEEVRLDDDGIYFSCTGDCRACGESLAFDLVGWPQAGSNPS